MALARMVFYMVQLPANLAILVFASSILTAAKRKKAEMGCVFLHGHFMMKDLSSDVPEEDKCPVYEDH